MKTTSTSIFILLFLPLFTTAQQVDLSGVVSIHNSKYQTGSIQYVKDAQVKASFSAPTLTDQQGYFNLQFTGVSKGNPVDIEIAKLEFELVNEHELRHVTLGRVSNLKVFMAPIGQLAQEQTELYDISLKALTAEHDEWINQLRKGDEESRLAIVELEQKLNQEFESRFEAEKILNERLEEMKKQLPKRIKQLAVINLDFSSKSYVTAYELYKEGRIEAALNTLDKVDLENQAQESLTNIAKINTDREGYLLAREKELQRVDQIVDSYNLKAQGYNLLFEYRKAVGVLEKAIALLEKTREQENLRLANAFGVIAFTYRDLGEYSNALTYQKKNVAIKGNIFKNNTPQLATSYNNLALIYKNLGDYQNALQNQQKAITIREQTLEANDPDIAISYNNLAGIYQDLGDYQNALQNQQKAITIFEQILIPNHPNIATIYNNLSLIYKDLGDYHQALKAQHKAIAIREQGLEVSILERAQSYNNLALIHQAAGDYKNALQEQQKAITIFEKTLEPDHPNIAAVYNNLALIYQATGDYPNALLEQQKAIAILEKTLEPNHPNISTFYNNLALIYENMGDYTNALQEQQKVIAILEKTLGPNHPSIAISYHNLTYIFNAQNALDSALLYEQKAYLIWKEKLPPSHPNLKSAQSNFAVLYAKRAQQRHANGQYPAALQDFHKALEFNSKNAGLYNLAGLCYYYEKDYNKAIESYKRSHQLNAEHEAVYLNNMGLAYTKWGKLKEAKTQFQQLQNLNPDNNRVYRAWFFYYAVKGNKQKALDNLEKAIQLGYNNLTWLTTEEALDTIREDLRFKKIITLLHNKQ